MSFASSTLLVLWFLILFSEVTKEFAFITLCSWRELSPECSEQCGGLPSVLNQILASWMNSSLKLLTLHLPGTFTPRWASESQASEAIPFGSLGSELPGMNLTWLYLKRKVSKLWPAAITALTTALLTVQIFFQVYSFIFRRKLKGVWPRKGNLPLCCCPGLANNLLLSHAWGCWASSYGTSTPQLWNCCQWIL